MAMAADGVTGFSDRVAGEASAVVFQDAMADGGFAPEMVRAPAGRFRMGSKKRDPLSFSTEWPRRTVRLRRGAALAQHQTTFDDYDRYVAATGAPSPDDFGWGRGRRPVINVSWDEAVAYCAWLSLQTGAIYRLPSEAEWEYMARAGADDNYATGVTISSLDANFNGTEPRAGAKVGPFLEKTVEVGRYAPNAWGLHDMHGNVCEWCADPWFDSYVGAPCNGAARRAEDLETWSPMVVRGGGWSAWPRYVRSTDRWNYARDGRFEMVGFRVARELDAAR